jgi:TolB protein
MRTVVTAAAAIAAVAIAVPAAASAPASFAARNGLIVFSKKRHGNVDLYTATASGKHLRRLTKAPGQDLYAAWSPDGTRIAYTYYFRSQYSVWITSATRGRPRRLTPRGVGTFDPSWSPDGTHLAVGVETPDGADDIEVLDVATGALTNVTNAPGDDLDPAWSPDGAHIAFATNRDDPNGNNYDIYVTTLDGSTQTRATTTPDADDGVPVWSPDGSRLAYVAATDAFRIVVMNADGSNGAFLTVGLEPAWSPDGTRIVFARDNQILVMNPDGSGVHRIAKTGVTQGAPDWQPLR